MAATWEPSRFKPRSTGSASAISRSASLGVCGVTWAADAAEIFIIAFALPKITEEFGLTTFQSSVVVSSAFLGMLAGAWFWGTVSDRIGRKRGFTITIGILRVVRLPVGLLAEHGLLCRVRVLAGFGLGGAVPLDFSLFAEYLPTRNRGRWLVILESFWGAGTVVAAGLAWMLVPTLGWRYLLGSSAVAGASCSGSGCGSRVAALPGRHRPRRRGGGDPRPGRA